MRPPDQMTDAGSIDLPKTLDHAHATVLRSQIEAMRGSPVSISAEHCQFFGGAGAELLLAAHAEWLDAGHTFTLHSMSGKFVADVASLGLQHSPLFQKVSEE